MRDVSSLSNRELDELAQQADATQGGRSLDAVYRFLGRFISYPGKHAQVAHTLWIVHAHLMVRWESTPRIAFLSAEPASGKSRSLEVSELLVPRAVVAVNMSPAYLFRKVAAEDGPPTILFDEIDTVFGPKAKDNEDIRALLNAGHRRGAVAGRCVVHGKQVVTEELPAYAAVALAGLGWLLDTILSRSIIVRMRRRHTGENIEPFRRRLHAGEGHRLSTLIESWARSCPDEIDWPELPIEIQDRDADVWEPLIAVADLAGGDWPRRARAAAVALVAEAKEAEPSLGIRLLADLRLVFAGEEMPSKAILTALQSIEESPWRDLKGRTLDERGLANRLRQYGVKSRTIRTGVATPKGYRRADLHDAWERYLPPSPARSATSATSATSFKNMRKTACMGRQENVGKINDVALVADVADLAEDRGAAGAKNDWPELPECLKRTPPKLTPVRPNPPALGPPGDSLDDF